MRRVALAALTAAGLAFPQPRPARASDPPPPAQAAVPAPWPDDRFHRVAALALLEELRASLLSEASATLTLERWCGAHRIAADPHVVAVSDPERAQPADAEQRALLGVAPDQPVVSRHVRLLCGGRLLSEADNWYVPGRLTPEMNRQLDATRTPFGKVIAPLGFSRTTLSSRLLWSPLPPDWTEHPGRVEAGGVLHVPDAVMENRALLHDRAGRPLALLLESYRAGILGFAPPSP